MTIRTRHIEAGAVTTAKLAANAVTEATVAAGGVAGLGLLRVALATYDFSVDGGAVSTITPASNSTIPIRAVIYGGWMNVITAVAGGTQTDTVSVGLSAGGAGVAALVTAAAKNVAPWSTTGIKAIVPVSTAATAIKMSAAGTITVTINTTTVTSGKFDVVVLYYAVTA